MEDLPNEVCADCIKKLVHFSLFIDRVVSVQKDLFGIGFSGAEESFPFNVCLKESTTKPTIKQEPAFSIKQENFEFNKSTNQSVYSNEDFAFNSANGQDYYADAESDAYCEFCDVYFNNNVELKNHIVDFHSENQCNPRERANNCEIMEIITLENAAIIDVDENCVEETVVPPLTRVLKEEKTTETDQPKILLQTILAEHNYCRTYCSVDVTEDSSIVPNLKQEEMNVQLKSSNQTKKLEFASVHTSEPANEVEIDSINLIQCEMVDTDCSNEKIDESVSVSNHDKSTVSSIKTKICPICTAHCRTIYHYFVHRSKYHNWSKPRRLKRKLRYKCCHCSKMFVSKYAHDNHTKYSCISLRFKCSICQLEFSSGMSMLIHKRICRVLMAQFENVKSHTKFNKRLKNCSNKNELNASEKRDSTGQKTPRTISSMRNRSQRNRMELSCQKRRPECESGSSKSHNLNNEHTCNLGRRFHTLRKFSSQQSFHISDTAPAYSCNMCSKNFRIKSYLHQHLVTHNNERKYKCTMNSCTKVFKRLAGLNQHIRGYHYKIKPHVCTVCQHSYALKGDMRRCRHSSLQNKN
ncbi:Zinc finger protein [Pseudolycoriella hygida]|uniref:Zinc finger protein n=1 Tax=Pseudolycoriella hygida TaxID=35572 RepID=A0A9Q0S7G3_9DIPT|nr:Zinc finger protein [Pseudolycoriella hygida]